MLTEKQAAKILGVSRRTLQGWRLKGGGPVYLKMGKAIRYRASDLKSFIDESVRTSTSDPGPEAA